MSKSKIEWTESTWNPVTGCTKVSPGCKHCYAERMAERLRAMGQPNYRNGFDLTIQPHMLELPLKWKKPQTIFVNSMSDLFHEQIPTEYIHQVFDVMCRADRHIFQILTKRSERLVEVCRDLEVPSNVWLGVSIENADYLHRADDLREVNTPNRFLSCEPLLGPLDNLDLTGIAWVIGGGESGAKRRPMDIDWIRGVRDQCTRAGVRFHFKQWGGATSKAGGRTLDGRTHDDVPRRVKLPVVDRDAVESWDEHHPSGY